METAHLGKGVIAKDHPSAIGVVSKSLSGSGPFTAGGWAANAIGLALGTAPRIF